MGGGNFFKNKKQNKCGMITAGKYYSLHIQGWFLP
jgi:hypothetical protein